MKNTMQDDQEISNIIEEADKSIDELVSYIRYKNRRIRRNNIILISIAGVITLTNLLIVIINW